mmetsp:Transcript_12259/g.22974  ORF Transcript_12259/g.22974 Transcript_12259/m.22974 type:complete len:290 (-) Transcript_12259:97-966(-)
MKPNDLHSKENIQSQDSFLFLKSDCEKGNDRKRIVLDSLIMSKYYDADESSSDDGLSYGSDTDSSTGEDYDTRCSFSDDDEVSKEEGEEEEVFSEDEIDFDLGDTFEELITSSKSEDECLYYFSCDSFESSFDLDEPLYTIQEEDEHELRYYCRDFQVDVENCYYYDDEEDDDDDNDDPFAMIIKRSNAFPMSQEETKDELSGSYVSKPSNHSSNFHHFRPNSYGNSMLHSFGADNSLFLSDLDHNIKLFTISEEPELEEELQKEERLSTDYRHRQQGRISTYLAPPMR